MAISLGAYAQEDVYKVQMDAIDAQGEQVMKEYRALREKDPKGELPETKARIVQLSNQMDSLSGVQLKLVRTIIRDNKNNTIPAKYILSAMYDFDYNELKSILDPTAAYYNCPELDRPKKLLAGMEKRAPGKKFTDLQMNDTDDRYAPLSQWVGKGQYVLVDFWASWCGPCRMLSPVVDEIAEENPQIKVGKINVDEEGDLAASFGVMSIPTLVVIKNGQVVNQSVGVVPKQKILGML